MKYTEHIVNNKIIYGWQEYSPHGFYFWSIGPFSKEQQG